MAAIGLTELILIFFIVLIPLIALVSILKNKLRGRDKLMWVIIVIFLPLIGSILYFIFGFKNKTLEG